MPERCVIVGAGGISNAWFPPIKTEGVEIAGIVDLRIDRARAQAEKYELECVVSDNLKQTLKRVEPDFAVDLTVPEAHCGVTCTALRAGCHVMGEKPMAARMTAARRMVRTADEAGKLYMVSQSRRWDGRHERLRRAIRGGAIGQVTTINCDFYLGAHFGGFRDSMPSPLILDMAIHHFDLARFFTGLDPVAVYAHEFNPAGSWYAGDVAATCIFEMSNGVVFTYRGSWCAEGCHTSWNGNWRIIGDQGTLLYEQDQEPHGQVVDGDEGFNRTLHDIQVPQAEVRAANMHGALLEMLDFLRGDRDLSGDHRPQTECHDNIKSLAMVFGAISSAKKRRRVDIRH